MNSQIKKMDKFNLSNYIAAKYPDEVTPLKLQKLLYYCYVWQLVAGQKKFTAAFEAWDHGPVEPEIYNKYKGFGRNPVESEGDTFSSLPFFDFIRDSYSVFSAIELSKTTHHESPWKKYQDTGNVIPDEELSGYYSQQPFARNFPLEEGKNYYPPKTSSHYSFTFDMERDYVPVFQSLNHYLNCFKEEKNRLDVVLNSHGIKNRSH